MYDKLVAKVNNIVTSGFVLKTKYDTNKADLEKKNCDPGKKILDTTELVKKTDCDARISEIENKIASISGLATNSVLTKIENKIPNVSNLVKKTDYEAKILEIEKKVTDHDYDKCIITTEFNKLTAENFAARLVQANLVTKTDFDNKLKSLNRKINSNKTKHVIAENKFKKLQIFDLSYFPGKSRLKKLVLKII